VTARFRRRLLERGRHGRAPRGRREEQAIRDQVARALRDGRDQLQALARRDRHGGCRWTRPITAAAASWRPWCPISPAAA
jgi:hypothetical protein